MKPVTPHLTTDDLDAFHSGSLDSTSRLHIETCDRCRALVVADRDLLAAFERLPHLAPSEGFADRVMAQVVVAKPARVPVISFPKLSKRRVALLGGLAAGMTASAVWSVAFRPELEALLSSLGGAAAQLGWTAVRATAAGVSELPWFDAARAWLAPSRLVPTLLGIAVLYGSGVMALRRLVTPTTGPVSGARA